MSFDGILSPLVWKFTSQHLITNEFFQITIKKNILNNGIREAMLINNNANQTLKLIHRKQFRGPTYLQQICAKFKRVLYVILKSNSYKCQSN